MSELERLEFENKELRAECEFLRKMLTDERRFFLETLKHDRVLYYEGYFDSLKTELAIKLDVSEDDIDMTVAYFTKCGLIQIDSDGNAELPQAKAMLELKVDWHK